MLDPFDRTTGSAHPMLPYCRVLCLLLCAGTFAVSCGRRGELKPPGAVNPAAVRDLKAEKSADSVVLTWSRPTEHADGTRMDNLAGFLVYRKATGLDPRCTSCSSEYQEVAQVPVEDEGMIRKARKFRLVQRGLVPGSRYRYKVFSFTRDGSRSSASNEAEIEWRVKK